MLCLVVLTFESIESVDEIQILNCYHSMKAFEQHFPVVLFCIGNLKMEIAGISLPFLYCWAFLGTKR